jgi:hypothetical protein
MIRSHQQCEAFEWAFPEVPNHSNMRLTIFHTSNYCGAWNHGSDASVEEDRNDPLMTLFQPLTEKDKGNSRVIFPEWLLFRNYDEISNQQTSINPVIYRDSVLYHMSGSQFVTNEEQWGDRSVRDDFQILKRVTGEGNFLKEVKRSF